MIHIIFILTTYDYLWCLATITQAGIEVVSTSERVSNKRKRNLNAYSGTVKVNTKMDTSRTTIPLTSIFGRILGDLQNFSGSKVQNGYQSAAGHMSDRTYIHCESKVYEKFILLVLYI